MKPMESTPREHKQKYILVAEDDKFLARVYEMKLKAANYEVYIATDGGQVLNQLQTKKPDLLLLDLMLPVKNGFEVLDEIRKNPNLKNIKVALFSNSIQEEEMKKAKDLGAIDYIVKSNISIDDLIQKIEEYTAMP